MESRSVDSLAAPTSNLKIGIAGMEENGVAVEHVTDDSCGVHLPR